MVKYRFLLKVCDRLIDYRIRLFVDFNHQFFQLHGRCDIIDELYEVDDTCEGIDEGDRREMTSCSFSELRIKNKDERQ